MYDFASHGIYRKLLLVNILLIHKYFICCCCVAFLLKCLLKLYIYLIFRIYSHDEAYWP